MHLNESSIEDYLNCNKPTVFALECLKRDIDATTKLQRSRVITISCYRSGVHEFLLFELCSMGRTFWMRFDRMPEGIRRKAIFWTSKRWPAKDSYAMSYHRSTLLADEEETPKLIELLSGISNILSIYHISDLMTIVREVSPTWVLHGTNCRWFCAITLTSLHRHFGGIWMVSALHDGIAQWRGFDTSATRDVEEIYRPQYLNTAFQAINSISMAVADAHRGDEANSRPIESAPSSPSPQGTGPKDQEPDLPCRATIFARVSSGLGEPSVGDLMSISAKRAAQLFKYMEVEIRTKYLEAEIIGLYALHCNSSDSQFRQHLAPFSEILAIWVKSSVVFAEDLGVRAKLVKHFVKIAKQSRKRHNYATALSIVQALSELEIKKITTTFRIVGEKTMVRIEKIKLESYHFIKQVPIHAHAVLPLKSDEMVTQFDVLRNDPQASLEDSNLTDRLCRREILQAHRTRAEPMDANLRGCYSLLLASMKSSFQKWDGLNFSARLSVLHSEECSSRINQIRAL